MARKKPTPNPKPVKPPKLPTTGQAAKGLAAIPVDTSSITAVPTPPPLIIPEDHRLYPSELEQARRLLAELARRQCEAIKLYKPLPQAEPFHACKAPEVLVYGSNRSGKTTAALVEIARAVTGQDPHDKYPKRDGRAYLVAFDGKQIAEVMWRKLGRAGAFQMIRDAQTKEWRAVNQNDPADKDRRSEWKPAPPLIPPRFIESIAWENKAQGVPLLVRLKNGWELHFFSSRAHPPQGVDIDIVLFDEEVENHAWYPEMAARLVDRQGRFIWSATPQAATEQLYDLYQRCGSNSPDSPIRAFFFDVFANKHLPKAGLDTLLEKYPEGSLDHEVRILGQFAMFGYRVYPEFNRHIHIVDAFPVPYEWTRYAIIDPGHQVCAVLFGTCPPPTDEAHGGHVYLYDELYLKNCDANVFGDAMLKRCEGQAFECFVIDRSMSRQTEVASGANVEMQYMEALRARGVSCYRTGHGFFWGSNDVKGGIESVKAWLRIRSTGSPILRIMKDKCPTLIWEIDKHRWKRGSKGEVLDELVRKDDHLVSDLRMFAQYNPQWVYPRKKVGPGSGTLAALQARKKLRRQILGNDSRSYVRFGPGP